MEVPSIVSLCCPSDFVTSRLSGLESNSLDWKSDAVGHGTHCSGTIAAAKNGIGVVGVAPDAELYTVKVFNDNGGFAYGSSIVSAVEECVEAGFNIVSMSLGGPLPNIFEWFAYQNLLENGVISIAAGELLVLAVVAFAPSKLSCVSHPD